MAPADCSITFRALCPCLHHKHQQLGVCGRGAALGNWDCKQTVLMEEIQANEWTVTLNAASLEFPLEYKFVACNADTKEVEEWEAHNNRLLCIDGMKKEKSTSLPNPKSVSLLLHAR